MTGAGPAGPVDGGERQPAFHVRLDNFEGPFDLLLQLISRHKLDVTEVALSKVTDEFIAHVKAGGAVWDLDVTSSFLVVAATLLDLKAARLLPSGEVEDPEDLALLEARDLLFARLLQYRAFKLMAAWIGERIGGEEKRHPRPGGLEPSFAALMPEVRITVGPEGLARLAARALTPVPVAEVALDHLHAPSVSVADQAEVIVERLRRAGMMTFRALVGDADRLTAVARFLALLELFRSQAVTFEQVAALAELTVRWTGETSGEVRITDEYTGTGEAGVPSDQEEESSEQP